MSDQEITLIVLGVVFIGLLLLIFSKSLTETSKTSPPDDGGGMTGDLAPKKPNTEVSGQKTDKKVSEPLRKKEKTLDEKYAEANGLLVCPRCEAFNERSTSSCQVCGLPLKDEKTKK